MYIKAPLVVFFLLSAVSSLALPAATLIQERTEIDALAQSETRTSETSIATPVTDIGSASPSAVRYIGEDGCIYKRSCDRKRDDGGCIYKKSCDKKREKTESITQRTCDAPDCINIPPPGPGPEKARCINRRTCDKTVDPDCINRRTCDKTKDPDCINKRTCD